MDRMSAVFKSEVAMFAKWAVAASSVLVAGALQAAVITIPQSALVPTQQLYTDVIGGGIGSIVVMTGGGNANGAGNPTGRNDDGYRGPIPFGFTSPFNFFGTDYTQFWANNNGNISFNGGISAYIPTGPIGANQPVISIWFADVDTRNAASGVMHIRQDIPDQLIVTWPQVGRYNSRGDLLNTFQMVIRGPNYNVPAGEGDIGFFWLGMPWEETDTSQTAAIGFGDGGGNAVIVQGTNAPNLHNAVEFHKIWLNQDLTPVCGVPGAPPCTTPEPATLPLITLGAIAVALGLRRRVRLERRAG